LIEPFKNVKKPAQALIVLGLGLPTGGHAQKIQINAVRQYPLKISKNRFVNSYSAAGCVPYCNKRWYDILYIRVTF
jgi:hypothetical protein